MYKLYYKIISFIGGKLLSLTKKLGYKPSFNFSDYDLVFAFSSKGVNYYQFASPEKIPAKRLMAAQDVFSELDFKVERGDIIAYLSMIIDEINKDSIDRNSMFIATKQLYDRMGWITNIDVLYKLASVYFVDENESIVNYDHNYALRKIERWRRDISMNDFFLSAPMKDLFPSLPMLKMNIVNYTKGEIAERKERLHYLLSRKKKNGKEKGIDTYLTSQMEMLNRLSQYLH